MREFQALTASVMALSLAVVLDEVGVGDIRSNNVKVLVIGSEYAKKSC